MLFSNYSVGSVTKVVSKIQLTSIIKLISIFVFNGRLEIELNQHEKRCIQRKFFKDRVSCATTQHILRMENKRIVSWLLFRRAFSRKCFQRGIPGHISHKVRTPSRTLRLPFNCISRCTILKRIQSRVCAWILRVCNGLIK